MVDANTLKGVVELAGGRLATKGQAASWEELAKGANSALLAAPPGLTWQGCASYLADKAQESDYFRATEEYNKNGRYAPYIGRTFQQLTWVENYRGFGRWCKSKGLLTDSEYFVKNPTRLRDYKWAWLGGVWYFEHHNIWRWANKGDHLSVSQAVNRGINSVGSSNLPNHWSVRKKMFDAFMKAGARLLPSGPSQPVPIKANNTKALILLTD